MVITNFSDDKDYVLLQELEDLLRDLTEFDNILDKKEYDEFVLFLDLCAITCADIYKDIEIEEVAHKLAQEKVKEKIRKIANNISEHVDMFK